MERKSFIKSLAVAAISAPALTEACKKHSGSVNDTETSATGTTTSPDGSCSTTNSETDGPYPLYTNRGSALNRTDITDGKTGIPLNITLTIKNVNTNCTALSGARVDIWHCDKDGYYSGYSNSGYLGTQNNSSLIFCRGYQETDSNGQVKFTSIYPGWYTGRITHIHAQIYVNNNLKLTTQIAFPEAITKAVYATSLYSAHGQNTSVTSFSADNVFSDGTSNEMATVTVNSTTGGYDLSLTIYVSA
ncbi:intradiol ring-cleavage dioxygenase (plasmid) [Pedobacter sp. BS3]|uniref:dioxygenase family protein n=1 Tax=Pedobacter sp. BS3 TaxID=2567937 RepID=UPI0011EBA27B|nr:intradiol ring-cleavage dioxygenase [Pedobacter sp. BS3]TZF85987.1 intradiol ring-cleavage dioxygenase [Pedobacter sp. BS3]